MAVFSELALAAEGRDWLAEVLPVGNKQIIEGDPMWCRQLPAQRLFSFLRCLRPHITPSVADPMYVNIHTDAGLAITDRHHQVRRLPSNP